MNSNGVKCPARRGAVMVYGVVAMVAFVALCSLAVDYGRVQLAKTELQSAVDAAARAGAAGLGDGTAVPRAAACARQNAADGSPVVLSSGNDVRLGHWDPSTRQFIDGGFPIDAIKVTTGRTAGRGNAVPLAFASIFGSRSCDVTCTAVASAVPDGHGIIGLDHVNMNGKSTDSYWSDTGAVGSSMGSVESNGDITLGGNTYIQGNARPGIGKSVIGADHVSGSVIPLTSPLVYPAESGDKAAMQNDNGQIPAKYLVNGSLRIGDDEHLTLPGGTYYVKDFTMGGGSTLDFGGPATIYCYGSVSLLGGVRTAANSPHNLRIVTVVGPTGAAPGSVYISGNAALYVNLYAPLSPLTLAGTGDLYGMVVAKSIDMTGNSIIHYDLSLDPNNRAIKLMQ